MQLTAVACGRKLTPWLFRKDRLFQRMMMKEQAKHFRLKVLRTRTGMCKQFLRRALVYQNHARIRQKTNIEILNDYRLSAACGEHDIESKQFLEGLENSGVGLNKTMLAILAIYEPRSFESLVELSQRTNIELLRGKTETLPERRFTSLPPIEKGWEQ